MACAYSILTDPAIHALSVALGHLLVEDLDIAATMLLTSLGDKFELQNALVA